MKSSSNAVLHKVEGSGSGVGIEEVGGSLVNHIEAEPEPTASIEPNPYIRAREVAGLGIAEMLIDDRVVRRIRCGLTSVAKAASIEPAPKPASSHPRSDVDCVGGIENIHLVELICLKNATSIVEHLKSVSRARRILIEALNAHVALYGSVASDHVYPQTEP